MNVPSPTGPPKDPAAARSVSSNRHQRGAEAFPGRYGLFQLHASVASQERWNNTILPGVEYRMDVHIWLRHHKDNTLRATVEQSESPRNTYVSGAVDFRPEPFTRVREADREHHSLESAQAYADAALEPLHICNDTCSDWYRLT